MKFTILLFVTVILGLSIFIIQKEFNPKVSLQKYEWFKDASNEIIRKGKDIELYKERVEKCYKHTPEKCSLLEEQLFGLKSNYNALVAEYNSNSDKFNWTIYNMDNLPLSYEEKK
jgi:hypothetical protein